VRALAWLIRDTFVVFAAADKTAAELVVLSVVEAYTVPSCPAPETSRPDDDGVGVPIPTGPEMINPELGAALLPA
jgi:hypothetical protein